MNAIARASTPKTRVEWDKRAALGRFQTTDMTTPMFFEPFLAAEQQAYRQSYFDVA